MRVKKKEKTILVGLRYGRKSRADFEADMEELEGLVEAAGGVVMTTISQNRSRPDPATYVGKGKIEELFHLIEELEPNLIVFDTELSPVQLRNIEEQLKTRIVDRTMLILDIFGQRAKSNEGILQVELARLQYELPRLTGKGTELSRIGGGIGARGAGEQKLELDRRQIRRRIKRLKEQMEKVEKTRELHRKQRQRKGLKIVSLVGYTNAGKSSVFNSLCELAHPSGEVQVEAKDNLFQTLDTTTRKISISQDNNILISDTVGFIKDLPHHLIAAFKSTLEEAIQADLLIHVVDVSDSSYMEKTLIVQDVLQSLGADPDSILTVLNKVDLLDDAPFDDQELYISARTKSGFDQLIKKINHHLFET
ncbi:MAG TPA: GTPase HflX [Syntrophomonadaceae bacterium]|nr:GTPase HflX [Syntrophomonadaceae bacterium]